MTDDDKQAYIYVLLKQIKKYCRIDYDDDEDIVQMMMEAAFEKLGELIPGFDPYAMTSRQKLLLMMLVKDQYDNKDIYGEEKRLSHAASSMLLNEIYKGEDT
jgi:uncharacterized phage protein (predicted DNA packaging)